MLNAALDFDSYLVMRHLPHQLGCYFCSDVMAPRNSVRNRTLDQQCTVTRPGLAPIAGAVLVELLVALIHHPDGLHASPRGDETAKLGSGPVPHVIRGYLGAFTTHHSIGQAFPQCTACSPALIERFNQDGVKFILQALQDPDWLESLTGLDNLKASFDADDMMVDDDEEFE